jgi:nitrate/nitrite-specific signal transduction histidine kinase
MQSDMDRATHADILIGDYKGQLRLIFTDNGIGMNDIKSGSQPHYLL